MARLIDWLRAHAASPHTVETLAQRASMSARTLQRRFREATGWGPYEWLIRERIALAKDMLETRPRLSIGAIAERAGFGSEESMRRHFRRIAMTSPVAYRQQFTRAGSAR